MPGGYTVVVFDGSYEGFLNIVHAHYYQKLNPDAIETEDDLQQVLDAEYVYIDPDIEKARQVAAGIRKKISPDAEMNVYYSFLAAGTNYFYVYQYVMLGFKVGEDIDKHLQQDFVLHVHAQRKHVGREAHLLKGFCRFVKTPDDIYYCGITPVNNVLMILADHFTDRLNDQVWMIHDKRRGLAAVYNCRELAVQHVPLTANVPHADDEDGYEELWRAFFKSIVNEERRNKKLQRQLLPLYFRKNMLEFNDIGRV